MNCSNENDNRAALGCLIAGPCVIESADLLDVVAARLVRLRADLLAEGHSVQIYFKASFDKANRTSIRSFRGPGLEKGLQMLADVKAKHHLPILTDIHESWQAQPVSEVADVLQIPAFLCRQTDLLVAAARTGRIVNIKKAQFLSGLDMQYPVQKVLDTLTALLLHWSAKETAFKILHRERVDFRKHLRVLPFEEHGEGCFTLCESRTDEEHRMTMHYKIFPHFVLTYAFLSEE